MSVPAQYQVSGRSARAIVESVERGVEIGALAPGVELPSVRGLAEALGVSPATVAAAYRDLRTRGIAVSAERRGVRVARRPPLPGGGAPPLPAGVRDLASGNPDPALLPALPALPDGVAAHPGKRRLYGDEANHAGLVEAARAQLTADGVAAGPVAVVSGAMDGVERVLGAHLRPGDTVAVEDPGYPGVLDLARALGLVLAGVRVDVRGPVPEALAAALAAGARALVLSPRAQNPTGAALDAARAAELAAVLDTAPEVLVVEDDHCGQVAGAPYHTLTRGRARWAVVRSTSKWLGPDLRVAFLTGDEGTVARVEGRQRLGPGWVSHLLQALVAALVADPGTDRLLARAARTYARRRTALVDALADRGVDVVSPSGLNVWIPVPAEGRLLRTLHQSGWGVQPGEGYRLTSPPAVRVTIAALGEDEAPALADALASALRPARATNIA
jgi:DNA-binding transcriptional MocR family regulator